MQNLKTNTSQNTEPEVPKSGGGGGGGSLKKLQFVGLGGGGSSKKPQVLCEEDANGEDETGSTAHLDEECAKIFAMDNGTIHYSFKRKNSTQKPQPHRQDSYPHMLPPLYSRRPQDQKNSEVVSLSDDEGQINTEDRRNHHDNHAVLRKFSLPADGGKNYYRRRHHHHQHRPHSAKRRVSIQPEDLPLMDADREQLDSHRSDDPKGLRRPRTTRLHSNASYVHINRRDADGNNEIPSNLKKMYDHSPHAIFVELDELHPYDENEWEWQETARWIKYEEDVEEGVDRWGKPHVASLSFHSLLNLRKCLEDGVVMLDLEEKDLPGVAYRLSEQLVAEELIRDEDKGKVMRMILLRHRHVNEHHHHHLYERGGGAFRFSKNKHSYTSLQNLTEHADMTSRKQSTVSKWMLDSPATVIDLKDMSFSPPTNSLSSPAEEPDPTNSNNVLMMMQMRRRTTNDSILRCIPADAQSSSILVGEVDFLEQPAIAFIRLAEGIVIPSLTEVNIPLRFLFLLLGPKLTTIDYHEVGRSIATLMANQQFHSIAYRAETRHDLLSAINEFLDDSIVLPPGDWERQALLPIDEIKAKSLALRKRKIAESPPPSSATMSPTAKDISRTTSPTSMGGVSPWERTRKPWGGLVNDLKRRYPMYVSDIRDGCNAQCMAASIFMYFAALSGAIAFGGLLADKTFNLIGIAETLLCTSVSGILFALLSGQPLIIVGTTGPLLLFDESLYEFCTSNGIEFLTVRVYIGLWLAVIGLGVACLEGSVLVKFVTRFTEDIFSALIVLLYIIESVMKLFVIYGRHPLMADYCEGNETTLTGHNPPVQYDGFGPRNQPNTALFCTILALGTFAIAYYLKLFRNSKFLGRNARRALGDFGVPIAIILMVLVDFLTPQTYSEKLNVPEGLSPSNAEERGWFIPPGGVYEPFPIYLAFAASIPALLVYILLFMETHIAELIIDKKERKLRKGSGFHLDIVLVCVINVLCGGFGLPWICAATVRSLAHVQALTVMSRTHAPGEKPHLIEVKEQRITALTVSLLVGVSVLMAPLLRQVPMAVLFGVFLYMGVASIDGIQFFDRIKLLFVPVKHHPRASYVRRVTTRKMHLFTLIQLCCLVVLWTVKSTKISLAFPFFLILMVPLRAHLDKVFTQRELRALDGEQPDADDDDEPDFYAEARLPG